MGMLACYMEASARQIDELKTKTTEEIFDELEALETEDACTVYDMDKLWDGLHFILTGSSAAAPVEHDPLSEAVVGADLFSDEESELFITCVSPERAAEIYAALEAFNIEKALADFSPEALAARDIYPNIWFTEDKELLTGELRDAFEGLKEFYGEMRERQMGAIVSIY